MPFRKTLLAALLAASSSQAWAQLTDSDADLLIDIRRIEDLQLMNLPPSEWQARCLSAPCRGFELVNDLDFDTDGDGDLSDEATWNGGQGFTPIVFSDGIFEGNHHTISNLHMRREVQQNATTSGGLFASVHSAEIRNLVIDARVVEGNWYGGILAANVSDSHISGVLVSSGSSIGSTRLGGMIGVLDHSVLTNSGVSADVTVLLDGEFVDLGGLVGLAERSTIERSWSNATVIGTTATDRSYSLHSRPAISGLVGTLDSSRIIASYSNGNVFGSHAPIIASGLAYTVHTRAPFDGAVIRLRDSRIVGSFYGARIFTEHAGGLATVHDTAENDFHPSEPERDWESARNRGVIEDNLRDLEHYGAILEGNLYFGSISYAGPRPDNLRIRNQTPQLARDPSLEVDNYWVRDTSLENGEIEPLAGAYSAQDLKCPTMPSDPNCGDGTLYAGWDLIEDSNGERIWYFGEGNETPFLYTKSLYAWQDNENPGGNGDYETRARIESNDPDNECLDDEDAEIEAKIPGSGVVIRNNYPDVLASFNLRDGLICQNSDQADGSCGDYEVSYMCGPFWTQWESRDTPNRNSDAERRDRSDVVCSNPTEIRARLISDPDTIYYGPHDRLSSFSANEGLVCRNGEQGGSTCSNYAVRLTCNIKGQPRNQRDI